MQRDRDRRRVLAEDEAPSRLRLVLFVGAWVLVGVLAFGFLAARAVVRARGVSAALDDRAAEIRQEIADARQAAARRDDLLAEIAALEQELRGLRELVPCESEIETLVPDVRARLEPLGVEVRADMGFRQRREPLEESRIPIILPRREDAEADVRRALSGSPRLLALVPWAAAENARLVVAWAGPRCLQGELLPPSHREPIPYRDGLRWPFDREIVVREKEIERLRAERDAVDGLADLLRRDHARWEVRTLKAIVEEKRALPGAIERPAGG